jgi:hypothetical protein
MWLRIAVAVVFAVVVLRTIIRSSEFREWRATRRRKKA